MAGEKECLQPSSILFKDLHYLFLNSHVFRYREPFDTESIDTSIFHSQSCAIMPSDKMKALRFHGQKDIRLENIDVPKCGKGQVKVKSLYFYRESLTMTPA